MKNYQQIDWTTFMSIKTLEKELKSKRFEKTAMLIMSHIFTLCLGYAWAWVALN